MLLSLLRRFFFFFSFFWVFGDTNGINLCCHLFVSWTKMLFKLVVASVYVTMALCCSAQRERSRDVLRGITMGT